MIKVDIKNKQGELGWSAQFNSQEEVDSWISEQISQNSWGKPERWVREGEEDVTNSLETREVERLPGVLVTEHRLAAEYSVTQEDITAQELAKKESQEALAYLASTDWLIIREMDSGLACPTNIKTARAAARLKVIP